jgi:hypothetical protein
MTCLARNITPLSPFTADFDEEFGKGRAYIKWKFGPNFIAAWSGVGFIRHALGIV